MLKVIAGCHCRAPTEVLIDIADRDLGAPTDVAINDMLIDHEGGDLRARSDMLLASHFMLSNHDLRLPLTKIRLYTFDPLKSHFYIEKLGFTGVDIIFSYFAKK